MKVFATLLVCLFSSLSLTGCFDLGNFNNYDGEQGSRGDNFDAYYESFGDVTGVYKSGIEEDGTAIRRDLSYDLEKSVFNAKTVNKYEWESEDDAVLSQEYAYIYVPVKKSFLMGSLALYVKGDNVAETEVYVFLLTDEDELPENICFLGCPQIKKEIDEDGNEIEIPLNYDDPDIETAIAYASFTTTVGAWSSFLINRWDTPAEGQLDRIRVEEDYVILLMFRNNTGYVTQKNRCPFTFMNLLIYSAEENK
ncbi:MAG: hypothetical protein MJ072_02715 [Clostridia bacterium]|nr:hypothetical protein [Clostridia bacterium]